jgi:hypothetical protein
MGCKARLRGPVLRLGAALFAMACGGSARSPERSPEEIGCRRLAPGESEVLAEWGGPDEGISIADVAGGTACDQFIAGTTWGPLALGGQTLEGVTFIAHREASGEIGWVKAWQIGGVDWSELAAAPEGGVWAGGHAYASTDLGDGVLHPVGDGARVLARYAADGSLVALRVDPDAQGGPLASSVAAQRSTQFVYARESARLELLDDAAEVVWALPIPNDWFSPSAAPAPDGGVFAAGGTPPGYSSVLEHYDGDGAAVWRAPATGSMVRSLAVLPAGEVVLSGSRCPEMEPGSGCDEQRFVQLIEPNGDTRFDIAHDLGAGAWVTSTGTGQILLIGEDSGAHRMALQRVERDGRLGERHLFDAPAPLDRLGGTASGSTVWVAGTLRGDGVSSVERGFLLEMGL